MIRIKASDARNYGFRKDRPDLIVRSATGVKDPEFAPDTDKAEPDSRSEKG